MPGYKRQRTNGSYGSYKPRGAFQFKAPRSQRYSKIYQRMGENKFLDTAITGHVLASTGGTVDDSMNHVAQGTGESQRVGRQIRIHHVDIRGNFNFAEHATESNDICRFIVFLDKQANGAAATTTDILESANVHAFRNLANSKRFTILDDQHFTINSMNADAASNYGGFEKIYKLFKPFPKGIPVEFNNTAGAISEIRSNNIGTLFVNDKGNVAFGGTCRIKYSDA